MLIGEPFQQRKLLSNQLFCSHPSEEKLRCSRLFIRKENPPNVAEGLTQSGCWSRKSAGLIDYLCSAVYLKGAGSLGRKSFQTDNEMKCVRIAFLETVLLLILCPFFPHL